MDVVGRRILVVGGRLSGVAAAAFLQSRGAHLVVNDAKREDEWPEAATLREMGIEVAAGGHPLELFENSDLIVVSPGVPLALEPFARARAAGVEIIGEVELAARFIRGSLVGITGSNGKTTTTALTGGLLARAGLHVQVGGNIGTPLTSLVDTSRDDGFTVIEMSSFQLEAVSQLRVHAAAILNITPDHMDRYASLDAYAQAKSNILLNQKAEDTAVLNADDERVSEMRALTPARIVQFSRRRALDEGISLRGSEIVLREKEEERVLFSRDEIRLRGDHNLENVMAAFALGLACQASAELMRAGVREFKGVEHRIEFVEEIDGVKYYNDSKATNVDATIMALRSFPERIVIILGGKDKGSDYAPLKRLVGEHCSNVVLIGAAADKIAAALENVVPVHRAPTLEAAVGLCQRLSARGDVVLLAPACASFDMFNSYEHRGRVFKESVRKLVPLER
jgi:UDP-N-acetylmuramoylalanine--D-glutamate ligase